MFKEFLAPAQLPLMDIGAARKGAAGAGNDRDLGFRIEIKTAQRVRQMTDEIIAERIELFRAD